MDRQAVAAGLRVPAPQRLPQRQQSNHATDPVHPQYQFTLEQLQQQFVFQQ